jgi:hypothetical protein
MDGGLVFILGAGASVHAGAPVMKNFFQRAKHLYRKRRFRSYEEDYRTVEQMRSILRGAKIKSRFDVDNLEEVYTALEMIELINGIDGLSVKDCNKAKSALNNVILVTLQESIEFPIEREENGNCSIIPPKAYEILAKEAESIRRSFPTFPLSVLTFNYDLAFDVALLQEKSKFSYCLNSETNARKNIRYCKLHGSLNWGIETITNKVECAELNLSATLNDHDLLEVSKVRLRVDELWESKKDKLIQHPLIVPPTGEKQRLQNLMKPVWKEAAKILKSAEILVIIGYSFPVNDQFFKSFFSLSTIGKSDLEKVFIIDPSKESADNFLCLLSPDLKDRFEHLMGNFEDRVNDISKIIDNYMKCWN